MNKTDAIARADAWARRKLHRNLAKLMELAEGVLVTGPTSKGEKPKQLVLRDAETGQEEVIGFGLVVYRERPNLMALQYLVDRGMGKVPTRVEVTGDSGGPVAVIPWRPALEAGLDDNYIDAEFSQLDVRGEEEGREGQAAERAGGSQPSEPQGAGQGGEQGEESYRVAAEAEDGTSGA